MVSKSSGEIFGTWLIRSIRKRPTVLSAATLPDWAQEKHTSALSGTQSLWPRKRNNKENTKMHELTSDFFSGLTSTSSAYCSTMVRVSWILAEADPTCCKSLDKPITRLGLKQVFMIRSTESKRRISGKKRRISQSDCHRNQFKPLTCCRFF